MATTFTSKDLMSGLTPSFFLGLLDDVKWRDTFAKFIQYALRTYSAFVVDFDLLDDKSRKYTAAQFNTAAAHISLARRVFRFIRWTRNVDNFFSDVSKYSPTPIGLIHATASICGCICEDITTLGKLGFIPAPVADRFAMPGNYSWLTESITGVIIHGLKLKNASSEVVRSRVLYNKTKTDPNSADALITSRKRLLFQAIVELHFCQVNFTKWVCEVIAASHDSQFHRNTKTALVAALISAFVSTYSHSAKFFKVKSKSA